MAGGWLRLSLTCAVAAAIVGPAPAFAQEPASVAAAYRQYREAIAHARQDIRSSAGVRPGHEAEDMREGELFLQSIVNASVTMALIKTPDAPVMALLPGPNDRLGLNNPDNLYYASRISDGASYVISGKRGLARTLVIQALSGLPGLSDAKGKTLSFVTDSQIHPRPDGSFSIALSPTRPARGDWLELKPGTDNLLVRFSFQDWEKEHAKPGAITIAKAAGPSSSPLRVTPALAAGMLRDAAVSIAEQAAFYSRSYALAAAHPNQLVGPKPAGAAQAEASNQWNLLGAFAIEPDEALIVTVKNAPQADYNNIEAANPWMNTFEFVHHQSSLNRSQFRVDADGYVRYVVSPVDPGVPNWIDTTGATHGWVWSRWQDVHGPLGPEFTPKVEVVKRADLRSHLPSDTPVVSAGERRASLLHRAELLRQRFAKAYPAKGEVLRRLHGVEAVLGHKLEGQTIAAPVID
jgi:hypothetical protein